MRILLPAVVGDLIGEGKAEVKVLKSADRWYGVTYKEDKETVVNAIRSMKEEGIYPKICGINNCRKAESERSQIMAI